MSVTKKDLEQLVRVLNNRLGRPQYGWDRVGNRNVAHVGAFTLDGGYGTWALREVIEAGGAEQEHGPRMSKSDLARYIRAILIGIDLAEVNIRSAAPHLDGLPGWGETPDQDGPHGRTSPAAQERMAEAYRAAGYEDMDPLEQRLMDGDR